jgi:hypothetical protein
MMPVRLLTPFQSGIGCFYYHLLGQRRRLSVCQSLRVQFKPEIFSEQLVGERLLPSNPSGI